ncbi:MAG: sigma-70 family RNA polymerase sigma factor [bacterium]
MVRYSDAKIIEGIRKKKSGCLNFVYKDYFPLILAFVEKNSGTLQDAQDVFQDGLMALYLRCRDRELTLNCALRTYFYSVCRNLWLQRLERKYRILYWADLTVHEPEEGYEGKDGLTKEQKLARHRIFWKHFNQLPDDCQMILMMYMDKIPCKNVAETLGFTDENYAKVRKYLCKNLLRKRVKRDPEYQTCINHG